MYSFTKARLIEFINTTGGHVENEARDLVDSFPIRSAPTLYVIMINQEISIDSIIRVSSELAREGRDGALPFQPFNTVNAVYMTENTRLVDQTNSIYEINLRYEKRVEITESNINADDYMESKKILSLETALFWFSSRPQDHHGIIACGDFAAVKPCMNYLTSKLGFHISQPELTPRMLEDISSGCNIRNATFSALHRIENGDIDVKTITIYDDDLAHTNAFINISAERNREQRSGFYTNHPGLLRAGIGITRNYGRIWTPAYLNRTELLGLSLNVISRLERQLIRAADEDERELISYYSNVEVKIKNRILSGKSRKIIDDLLSSIVRSYRDGNQTLTLANRTLRDLIQRHTELGLLVHFGFECPNCMGIHAVCPTCNSNLEHSYINEQLFMYCPACDMLLDNENYTCTCGEQFPIVDLFSNIILTPEVELLDALKSYAQNIHPAIAIPDLFLIKGGNLIAFSGNRNANCREIQLEELELWRTRARLQFVAVDQDIPVVKTMREKCRENDYHPNRIVCDACFQRHFTQEALLDSNICLLRAFGLPINENFDGIHCGREKADIIYNDRLNGNNVLIGIHVKSYYDKRTARGLGRSISVIKGLYTQIYYSLYKVITGAEHYDILGIAIPNRISQDVTDSIKSVLFRFGISFLVVDVECWKRIMKINIDNAQFI